MTVLRALKGISGEFELGRMLLAASGVLAVTSPLAFEVYEVGFNGGHFDVTAWCLAYPGGLATLVTAGVLGIGGKDRNVAIARQTQALPPLEDTGGKVAA